MSSTQELASILDATTMPPDLVSGGWRLTVVATDRPGLLADTASALAHEGCSIASASAASWTDLDLALHSVTIFGAPPNDTALDRLGARLRSAPATPSGSRFMPVGRAKVQVTGETDGDAILTVTAPDQAGLLAAICRWFADRGASIQAAWVAQNGAGLAEDVFVVRGPVDRDELERFLGVPPVLPANIPQALNVAGATSASASSPSGPGPRR